MVVDLNNIPEFLEASRGYMIEAAINIQKKKDEELKKKLTGMITNHQLDERDLSMYIALNTLLFILIKDTINSQASASIKKDSII